MIWLSENLIPLISTFLIFAGAFFVLVGSIGLLRMPDLFLRMSAATKASTLGAGLVLLGTAVYFGQLGITTRAIATIFFLLLTGPVAAHMIAKASYSDGIQLWERTQFDDLAEAYDNRQESVPTESTAPTTDSLLTPE